MKLKTTNHNFRCGRETERGSVLVIVLLITIGLISLALYFANSMTLELRASDNRTSGLAADQAIIDWRTTNGTGDSSLNYSQGGYLAKHAPFESVGELRLVYNSTMEILAGDDINRNGVLDANERDANGNGQADAGAMENFTI